MFCVLDSTFQITNCRTQIFVSISLSSVFSCKAGSGYPDGHSVLGNIRGGFPLAFLAVCDHILWSEFSFSLALFVRGTLPVLPSCSRGRSPIRNPGTRVVAVVPQPSASLSHQPQIFVLICFISGSFSSFFGFYSVHYRKFKITTQTHMQRTCTVYQ